MFARPFRDSADSFLLRTFLYAVGTGTAESGVLSGRQRTRPPRGPTRVSTRLPRACKLTDEYLR